MIRIALHKGSGFISGLIKLQTRSEYSHVSIIVDGVNYEAWHVGGVQKGRELSGNVDIFELTVNVTEDEEKALVSWLDSKLGCKYDFLSVARFVSRVPASENNRYFCSELVADALLHIGIMLLRGKSCNMSPRDISLTPLIKYVSSSNSVGK